MCSQEEEAVTFRPAARALTVPHVPLRVLRQRDWQRQAESMHLPVCKQKQVHKQLPRPDGVRLDPGQDPRTQCRSTL